MTDDNFSIMCFTWNASGLKLCETTSQEQADKNREGLLAFMTRKKECTAPDFFDDISLIIKQRTPSLVVMTTQEEDNTKTYFHSSLLPTIMPKLGYTLLKRTKLPDILTKYGRMDRIQTGQPSTTAVRLSVYAYNNIIQQLLLEEQIISGLLSNIDNKVFCNEYSGAVVSYVWHPKYGKFAFIAIHLTSQDTPTDYAHFRSAARSTNNLCLLNIYNKFITSLEEDFQPDHIFLLGDFNYDIIIPGKTNAEIQTIITSNITPQRIKELQAYDELIRAKREVPLVGFKEGVSSEGPLFLPTWKLARMRGDSCNPDKNAIKLNATCLAPPNERTGGIGWHDRILYKESLTSNYLSHCTMYNRIDIKNMHLSMNAGVSAFFEMRTL